MQNVERVYVQESEVKSPQNQIYQDGVFSDQNVYIT